MHTEVVPVILPGCTGTASEVTDNVLAVPLPQLLLATTESVPPADPAVTEMLLEVELPVQPEGSVHVYDVAPATEPTE
jgi:hypothetical protein